MVLMLHIRVIIQALSFNVSKILLLVLSAQHSPLPQRESESGLRTNKRSQTRGTLLDKKNSIKPLLGDGLRISVPTF